MTASVKRLWLKNLLTVVLTAVGVTFLLVGTLMLLNDARTAESYVELAQSLGPADTDDASASPEQTIDTCDNSTHEELLTESTTIVDTATTDPSWEALIAINKDTVGWLSVEGTSINLPITQSSTDDPDFYLTHDFWSTVSTTGTPYLAAQADPDGLVLMIFGHHTTITNIMFHDLADCFEQSAFNDIGTATWITPNAGATNFEPLCSLRASSTETTLMNFGANTEEELRTWLAQSCTDATAVSDKYDELLATATRALLLVTCTGSLYGSSSRTITVFVCTD